MDQTESYRRSESIRNAKRNAVTKELGPVISSASN